jgi:hypothetical protein
MYNQLGETAWLFSLCGRIFLGLRYLFKLTESIRLYRQKYDIRKPMKKDIDPPKPATRISSINTTCWGGRGTRRIFLGDIRYLVLPPINLFGYDGPALPHSLP